MSWYDQSGLLKIELSATANPGPVSSQPEVEGRIPRWAGGAGNLGVSPHVSRSGMRSHSLSVRLIPSYFPKTQEIPCWTRF
jgi:hypothetical protein